MVGNVGTGVAVFVGLGVLLGLMVAVAWGVSGVQVGCKEVSVAVGVAVDVGTVGTWATLALVGNGVDVSKAFAIWTFTSLLNWVKLARSWGERINKMNMMMASAAKMSNAAVNTFRQLPLLLLDFF